MISKKMSIKLSMIPLILGSASQTVLAESAAEVKKDDVEVISIIGSRSSKQRTVADSPVPVDIINADDINAVGGAADMTDNLKALIPSYTATPATGDGSAFVRPTSLRGTSPDQTLVLINGKRRHRSALVQFFAPAAGNGAHGPDVGMIPSIAIKRVEVLRDGAASQYGSDAIAGVINFVTKDDSEGGTVELQYGQHYEGESSMKLAVNKGLALGDDGFLNLSLEYADNDALSRGVIRPDAQALIDAGVQGVGADSPFGDAPFTQTWGRPETSALRMFANTGIELTNDKQLYGSFSYAETEGRYRFFYRNPNHSTIDSLKTAGYTGKLTEVGFTPYLDGDQTDYSGIIGLKGDVFTDTSYDLSISTGTNELDYFLNNSVNPGLGLASGGEVYQMNFDTGGYKQEEININADFSTFIGDDISFAYGFEWREETYTSMAGELNSYSDINGSPNGGVSGMRGIEKKNAGSFSRDNAAVYVDIEQDVTDELLLQYALRYENYSDFGGTTNWKIAGNYTLTDDTSLRAAVSTGFHAPTPGQANVSSIITTFDGTGQQQEEGLIPATSALAISLGGQELKEEESFNISLGLSTHFGDNTTLTADLYQIAVDDRIYRTGNIDVPDDPLFDSVSFYTNVLDVEHSGVDIVLTSNFEWNNISNTEVAFAYGYNKIDVVNVRQVNGESPVKDSTVEDIENNFPNHRFVLTTNTSFGDDWNLMLRANFYGSHYDERGTINGTLENGQIKEASQSAEIDPVIYLDAEVSYQMSNALRVKLGFSNILDTYIDEIEAPYANRQSVGLQYPRRSAANYEGGSWYLGLSYQF
ncbi:MAG: TonB-dependent receptor [Litorilituus sp.]|jgi:iron complex outermembrane receptor protein|nr:TonB-dependent receptor [Litorilituus sp.]